MNFNNTNNNVSTRLLGYDAQTSLLGTVIPIVYGVQRLSGNVIWVGNWTTFVGGKGLKTKGSNSDVDYRCALIIGLCSGPISGIQNVWSNKDEYNLVQAVESYTVPGGGGTHNSNQLSQYVFTSIGVTRTDTATVTYSDPGDPVGVVTKTVSVQTPMKLVDTLTGKGQYTYGLDPSGGHAKWTFSSADASAVMTIVYNYVLSSNGKPVSTQGNPLTRLILAIYNGQQGQDPWGWLEQNAPAGQVLGYTELAYAACPLMDLGTSGVIPSYNFEIVGRCGFNLLVGGSIQDCLPTDIINDILTNPLDGVLGWVSTTTSASGEGLKSFSGICTVDGVNVVGLSGSDFTLLTTGASFCINGIQFFISSITDPLNLILTTDAGQQPDGVGWVAVVVEPYSTLFGASSYLPADGSNQGLIAHSGTCNVSGTAVTSLGNTGEPRSLFTVGMVGSNISIAGTLYRVASYTDQFHIVLGSSAGTQSGVVWSGGSDVACYCAANGIFLSLAADSAQDARQWINDVLDAANADCFWSEGMLKFRSYGDTSAVGNGYIYTPDTAPIYDLTDADLICDVGQAPIKIKRKDIRDAENEVTIEWTNRQAGYSLNTVVEQDFAAVTAYGRRPADSKAMHSICSQEVAELVAVTKVRRSVYIDGGNQYEFTLPPHFCLLDPMDIVTLTDVYIGLNLTPVRITSIVEDDSLKLQITAEEFPWSCSAPTLYSKQGHIPTQPGFFTDPGNVNTPMFVQLPTQLTQGDEYQLGIAVSGSQNWGGCDVYMATSETGPYDTYVGHLSEHSTMGLTTASLGFGLDPDTVNTLSVDLVESYGVLASYTKDQADSLDLVVAVNQELLAYETATFTGGYAYDLTYLRRGVYDSINSTHTVGSQFCVLDTGILHWKYPTSVIGKTVWFKFCSVNRSGRQKQDLSVVTAFPCFITGPRTPFAWAPGFTLPISGDPLFTAETFGLQPASQVADDGSVVSLVNVLGNPPINSFTQGTHAPVINSALAVVSGGVKWVTIGSGGSGYLGGLSGQFPLVFSSGSAVGYAVVISGVVINAIVTDGSSGYGVAPSVSFTLGGGSSAVGTAVLSTGGSVAAGTYALAVSALDAVSAPLKTPLSNIVEVTAAASSELVYNLTWFTGSYGGNIFVASPDALHPFYYEDAPGVGSATSGVANYSITSVGGKFFGAPDTRYDHMLLRRKSIAHSGSWAEPCAAPSVAYKLTFPGATFTTNQYANRYVSLLGCADQTKLLPVWDAKVVSNTVDTLTLNVDPTGVVAAGDAIVKRIYPSSISSTQFSDADGVSSFEVTGYAAHAESGKIAWWIAGGPAAGIGQQRLIQDNTKAVATTVVSNIATGSQTVTPASMTGITTGMHLRVANTDESNSEDVLITAAGGSTFTATFATSKTGPGITVSGGLDTFTLATPWETLPTADSIIIIADPAWFTAFESHSAAMNNYSNWDGLLATLEVSNVAGQTFLIQALTVDANGDFDETHAPIREIWMPGQPGNNASSGVTLQLGGRLAILSDAVPVAALNATRSAKEIVAYVKIAPTGADLTININLGGVFWMTLTIAAGTNSISATSGVIAAAAPLTVGSNISLDIIAVGTTFPGSDLSVFIYL